jgi:hypothetical protein
MRVIGIDPAPAKGGTLFDGEYRHLSPLELGEFLSSISDQEDVLVCWDAPLTGPQDPTRPGQNIGDFTQRPIETFFSRQGYGFKVPPGISVRGYAGCPHWTISRAYLGLPQIGPWDRPASNLPFKLLTDRTFAKSIGSGPFVVEVHPAVAIWRWCIDSRAKDADWAYKKSKKIQEEIAALVLSRYALEVPYPSNDDELDALVAWLLGTRWVEGGGDVELFGNRRSGSFLLPRSEALANAFVRYLGSPYESGGAGL